jgi:SNF2 family DNA or RNA helicase
MRLYPYQDEGVKRLGAILALHRRAYLADAMGLGKTAQAIVALSYYDARRVLAITPASARENWYREWKTWGPGGGGFAAVSYAATDLRRGRIHGGDWDAVILDEAHYAKSMRAKRTRAALTVARDAPRALLLSGTPMPNHPGELYAPFKYLWPEMLRPQFRTQTRWLNYFCQYVNTRYGPKIIGVKNGAVLRRMLNRVMVRRKLEDVALDLPPLRVTLHTLPKDAGFERALREAGIDADKLRVALENERSADDPSTSRARRLLGEYKAPRIGEIIAAELDDGAYQKIVVLYYHRAVGETLRKAFAPFGVVGFDGQTPSGLRQAAVDNFTNDPRCRVFLAQQTSAGEAINLQAASEIVLVEPAWSPDANRQAVKRVHRIGSKHPVRARIFGVAGTIDAAVMGTIAQKVGHQKEVGL